MHCMIFRPTSSEISQKPLSSAVPVLGFLTSTEVEDGFSDGLCRITTIAVCGTETYSPSSNSPPSKSPIKTGKEIHFFMQTTFPSSWACAQAGEPINKDEKIQMSNHKTHTQDIPKEVAWQRFNAVLEAMVKSLPSGQRTSIRDSRGDCNGTRTP